MDIIKDSYSAILKSKNLYLRTILAIWMWSWATGPAWAWKLDKMTFRVPFQPQPLLLFWEFHASLYLLW